MALDVHVVCSAPVPLGTPGSSPASEATLERGAPRKNLQNWQWMYETDLQNEAQETCERRASTLAFFSLR
jgi:hypothetical protein